MEGELGKPLETELAGNNENSGEGKLKIKLKFPQIAEPDPIEAISDDQLHVCEFCNRGFISGKALGGHMRVHALENRGDSIKISKKPNKINLNSLEKSQLLDSLSENPTCYLCGKGFPSIKSLFGHMRCHPEREYRGIQPPQTGLNHLSSSSSVSDERESTNPIFLRWSVKDKRGRMSLIPAATSSSSDEYGFSEEEKDVARNLMMLARGEPFHLGLPSKHKIEGMNSNPMNNGAEIGYKDQIFESKKQKIEDLRYGSGCENIMFNETVSFDAEIGQKDSVFESKKRRIEDLGYGLKCKKLKINETVPLEAKDKDKAMFGSSENLSSDDEHGGKIMHGNVSRDGLIIANMCSKKKKFTKKNPKFRNLESEENEGEDDENHNNKVVGKGLIGEYKCSTCNKCFPSHQALGGHRSSHNKFKNTNQVLDSNNLVSPPKFDHIKESNNIHQCKICNKIFPTGQALGGHQRCHWAGPTEAPVSSHATSSSGVLGFDLNEMPSMEEDDDGGVESCNDAHELLLYGYGS